MINHARNDKQPGIPRPWELHGKDADEYWQCVYQDVVSSEMKRRADDGRLAPWEEELLRWMENDAQFWNYKDDFKDMKLDEIPRFKTPLLRGDYFEVLKSLYPRILQELSKMHNPNGEDMNLLRSHLNSTTKLIAKLDPNVIPTSKDWNKEFASVLTHCYERFGSARYS